MERGGSTMTDELGVFESEQLQHYESVIMHGLITFLEVGEALLAIRDKRLYRGTHETFESYCREQWSMSDRHARRMIEATQVVNNLVDKTGPIGPLPTAAS